MLLLLVLLRAGAELDYCAACCGGDSVMLLCRCGADGNCHDGGSDTGGGYGGGYKGSRSEGGGGGFNDGEGDAGSGNGSVM